MRITRNLLKLDSNTRLQVQGRKGRSDNVTRTSRSNTEVHPSKAVSTARPFRQGEDPGLIIIRCLGNVVTILGIVEPLSGILGSLKAVQILDANAICGIDRQSRFTVFVFA